MSDPAVLLILGTRTDPHVDRVARELERRGSARVIVLDYHQEIRFSLHQDTAGRVVFRVDGTVVPDEPLVWDRTKLLPGTELYTRGDEDSRGYVAQEWRAFYKLLCGLHRDRVVNSLESRACMIKPYQQAIAAGVGFRVPPTLITNDKPVVQAFVDDNDARVIMKSVSAGRVSTAADGGDDVPFNVMTMRVSPEDLASTAPAEIAYCPHFFQREIAKAHELRVVVVDDQVLAFRVDSQRHEVSSVDWRKGARVADFSPAVLDDATVARIRSFMHRIGLFTGSLDLIVDPAGEVWFLECNQDGAWGWLDDISDGAVTRAFVDGFTRRLGAPAGGGRG